jgi:Co/Zn/Cd efflux system component
VIRDLHVWRIGPHAHAAIISLAPGADAGRVRERVRALPRMEHVTVEGV